MSDEEFGDCRFGYPIEQLKRLLADDYPRFKEWFAGQTGAICNGAKCSGKHGLVVYEWDYERFRKGLTPLD